MTNKRGLRDALAWVQSEDGRRYSTVPWAPGLERLQMTRLFWVQVRGLAGCWQLGIRKGFDREHVKAFLEKKRRDDPIANLALTLGMLEESCAHYADSPFMPFREPP